MDVKDITIRILEQIRDEIRSTRNELRGRIDGLRDELHGTRNELSGRLETVEHTLLELAIQQAATTKYLKEHVAKE